MPNLRESLLAWYKEKDKYNVRIIRINASDTNPSGVSRFTIQEGSMFYFRPIARDKRKISNGIIYSFMDSHLFICIFDSFCSYPIVGIRRGPMPVPGATDGKKN